MTRGALTHHYNGIVLTLRSRPQRHDRIDPRCPLGRYEARQQASQRERDYNSDEYYGVARVHVVENDVQKSGQQHGQPYAQRQTDPQLRKSLSHHEPDDATVLSS